MNNSYPFTTRRQIAEKIASDTDFALMCLVILHDRQTEFEQATRSTKDRNGRGFMSSHAVHGTRMAQAVLSGAVLEAEDLQRAVEMVSHYTRQIAAHLREEAKQANPDMAAKAAVYGV